MYYDVMFTSLFVWFLYDGGFAPWFSSLITVAIVCVGALLLFYVCVLLSVSGVPLSWEARSS